MTLELEHPFGPRLKVFRHRLENGLQVVLHVDRYRALADEIGARIVRDIADRSYGLRDLTIADPDGFGVRLASWLGPRA